MDHVNVPSVQCNAWPLQVKNGGQSRSVNTGRQFKMFHVFSILSVLIYSYI